MKFQVTYTILNRLQSIGCYIDYTVDTPTEGFCSLPTEFRILVNIDFYYDNYEVNSICVKRGSFMYIRNDWLGDHFFRT